MKSPSSGQGAAKYTRGCYGELAASALARFYDRSSEVMFFGSHAPGDIKFRADLMKAVIGEVCLHHRQKNNLRAAGLSCWR